MRFSILMAGQQEADRRFFHALFAQEGYHVLEARNEIQILQALRQHPIDLVLLTADQLDCCRRIKRHRYTQLVPVLIVADAGQPEAHVAAMDAGADDMLERPLHAGIVRARIRSLRRQKAITDRLEESESILFALGRTVEQRDHFTGGHCERLGWISLRMGMALSLSRQELTALQRGGYLHDIGKIAMPDSILLKAGQLSDSEWATMKTHTVRGEQICRPLKSLEPVLPIIRNHHERWDGSGYPDGMRGQEIPLLARILQLADIYDALTSRRPYKPPLPPSAALKIMEEETGQGWRDPELMALFLRLHHGTAPEPVYAFQGSLQELVTHPVD